MPRPSAPFLSRGAPSGAPPLSPFRGQRPRPSAPFLSRGAPSGAPLRPPSRHYRPLFPHSAPYLCHVKPLPQISTPWHYHFQRWLGRTLTPAERAVISPLEKNRCLGANRPAIVIDPEGTDTTALLKSYLLYRSRGNAALLMLPVRKNHRNPHPNIITATLRRPDSPRGLTVHSALVIGYRHRSPKKLRRIISTLLPMTCRDGLLIIHADRLPPTLPPAFIILRPIPARALPLPVPVQGAAPPARLPLRYTVLRFPKINRTVSAH